MNVRKHSEKPRMRDVRLLGMMSLAFLGACTSGPSDGEVAARNETAQLKSELAARDSLIGEMALSFDDIEKNIALMDEREKLLDESTTGELNMDQRQKIVRDVQLMNGLLKESRDRIADLTKRLDKSKIESGGLRRKLKELDGMLAKRDSSIMGMKDELLARDFTIGLVNEQLSALELEMAKREALIEQQTSRMNLAWYAMGTAKELEERGLVDRSGGFIGIGRHSTLNQEAATTSFQEMDVRSTDRLSIPGGKVKMITDHPADSYVIIADDDARSHLEIKDPAAFWRLSRYLVMEVK